MMMQRKNNTSAAVSPVHYAETLSFMRRRKPLGTGVDYWAAAPTGSYSEDCNKGRMLAAEFVEYLGEHPTNGNANLLTQIVIELTRRGDDKEGRGLVVGFMNYVGNHLTAIARTIAELTNPKASVGQIQESAAAEPLLTADDIEAMSLAELCGLYRALDTAHDVFCGLESQPKFWRTSRKERNRAGLIIAGFTAAIAQAMTDVQRAAVARPIAGIGDISLRFGMKMQDYADGSAEPSAALGTVLDEVEAAKAFRLSTAA
jgi:hypothetical protein